MCSKKGSTRIFLHTKDVIELTGRGYKSSLTILKKIRLAYNKPKNALVSITEFCEYMNVDEREIQNRLI